MSPTSSVSQARARRRPGATRPRPVSPTRTRQTPLRVTRAAASEAPPGGARASATRVESSDIRLACAPPLTHAGVRSPKRGRRKSSHPYLETLVFSGPGGRGSIGGNGASARRASKIYSTPEKSAIGGGGGRRRASSASKAPVFGGGKRGSIGSDRRPSRRIRCVLDDSSRRGGCVKSNLGRCLGLRQMRRRRRGAAQASALACGSRQACQKEPRHVLRLAGRPPLTLVRAPPPPLPFAVWPRGTTCWTRTVSC